MAISQNVCLAPHQVVVVENGNVILKVLRKGNSVFILVCVSLSASHLVKKHIYLLQMTSLPVCLIK